MSIFKKKSGQISATSIPMTEAEAALAQSDFNIEKITEIQNKFTGGAILLVPGRIFIREGLLWKVCRKGIKKRQFFLFNDILVYGSVVASRYSNQHSLSLDKMSVSSECFYQPRVQSDFDADAESLDQQLDPANAFQISHADKSFHVFSASAADKANWLANLNKHISRAAQLVADSPQQMMTRPVWVPDAVAKECMICHTKFSTFVRKHHCRRCGRVVCSSCSPHHVSLSSHDLGSSGHAPSSGEHKKLERVCKECFKEMTTQHNRSNSQSRSSRGPKPPPTLNHDELGLSVSIPGTLLKTEDHESTDTEDSDDSSDEKSVIENQSNVRTSSVNKQPDLKSDLSVDRLAKEEEEEEEEERESRVEGSDEPLLNTRVGSSEQMKGDSSDVQPTPPPRKKKLEKLLRKQIEANERTNQLGSDLVTDKEVEQGEESVDAVDEGDKELSSSRKTKRKMKHSKPPDSTVDTVAEPSTVESRALDETSVNTALPNTNAVTPETTKDDTEYSASHKVEDSASHKADGGEEEGQEVKEEELPSPVEAEDALVASTKATDEMGEEREVDQQHSPSQKKSRGRRKKFKTASERTDQAS